MNFNWWQKKGENPVAHKINLHKAQRNTVGREKDFAFFFT